MTTLQSDLAHKQPEHDAIANDIERFLSSGKFIEILGNTPVRKESNYNNSEYKKCPVA